MTTEWNVNCKRCGREFGYSDRSYTNSLQYGFSRPEYCENCQEAVGKMRRGIGTSHFNIPRVAGDIVPGGFGDIRRPKKRVHLEVVKERKFDEKLYGLTADNVRKIAKWFNNPNQRVVVVVGPTGSGKSTALPYWLVYPPEGIDEDFFTRDGKILVTQPRIVAVTGITEYLGTDLMGSSIGAGYDIGYSYSKEDKADWRNAIEFTTDGKLINWIIGGKIGQYGIIIIDEAHERSENIDTILRLLKDRMGLFPNLKLIIASATIDAEMFRGYFDQEGATIVEFEGKARVDASGKPVSYKVFFAPDVEQIPYEEVGSLGKALEGAVFAKAKWLVEEITAGRKEWGDVLVFLQGVKPIGTLIEQLRAWVASDSSLSTIVEVYPLHRKLEKEEKDKVLEQDPKPGRLRVIVSTNIAEASVTVKSVIYEIETGVEYQVRYNAEIGATEVPLTRISKANAKQRWGRTGRTRNGEVFCLYTEGQFKDDSLFPPYPVSAIQRTRMESVVLSAKTAGIPDVSQGWLQDPPETEVQRSTTALVASGALTKDQSITTYGLMVRHFTYPPRLFELLMAADDMGCSLEAATILPVIRNNGERRLLNWGYSWDVYTKRTAFARHQALWAGSRDDVEFILKLYKAWDELVWLDWILLRQLTDDELDSLRSQWADIHFVNHKVMLSIREERGKTLERLGVSAKEDTAQPIDLSQIGRLRTLLRFRLTKSELRAAASPYSYVLDTKPQAGSLVTCSLLASVESGGAEPKSWLEIPTNQAEVTEDVFSRLFVDQVYPVGSRFAARVEQREDERVWIKTTRNLTRPQAIVDQLAELEDEEDEQEGDPQNERIEEHRFRKVPGLSLGDVPILYGKATCRLAVQTTEAFVGEDFVVEITGFLFPSGQSPVVIAEIVSQPEPFDIFVGRYRLGGEVAGVVINILVYRNDRNATFVVQDSETNLEVLVEPKELGFKSSALAVKEILPGTRLKLCVESINVESRRVSLSNRKRTGAVVNNAVVLEINTGGVVVDLGQGLRGFAPRSRIMGGNSSLFSLIKVGLPLDVRVLKHDADRFEPLLEVTGGIEDPIKQFEAGKTYSGIVDNINQNGIFVVLAPSVVGRVRYDETYFGRYKAEDFIKPGDTINVRVIWISPVERRLDLSMKIPEHDPTTQIKAGLSYQGTVTSITQLGAFVELAPALVGLLRTQNFPKSSGFLGLGGPPKIEAGMRLVVRVVSIQPKRRDPTQKDVNLEYVRRIK